MIEPTRLGTATWAAHPDVEAALTYRDGEFWLGRLKGNTAVGYGDDRHICLVSGSRGGKGTSYLVNNLCLWPGSVVVVDPKGENATVTAARRGAGSDHTEGMGQTVHVLDPFEAATVDESYRSSFNPLDALDPDHEEAIDEASRLADALVVVRQDSNDPFWEESARAMVKGLILHVLTGERFEGRRDLTTVRALITRGDWEAVQALRDAGEQASPYDLLWAEVEQNPAFDGRLAGIGATFFNMLLNSPKQFESVLQVANRNTEFLDSPAMRRSLVSSDFSLADLKTDPAGVSLYLCLPQRYMNTHFRWLRMMIALIVTEMEIVKGQPASGSPILVMLDEFAGLKRMEVIETAVAQIAGYGVKLCFALQSLEQLKGTYKDNWQTFLSNAGLKIFFGLDDHFSREYVSKLIGDTEIVRQVRSVSESRSESESVSHSQSHSVGESQSTGRSHTLGESRSDSKSRSQSKQYRPGAWFADSESDGSSVSKNRGTSESRSDSVTQGASRTTGHTRGTTSGISRANTQGISETVHRRALISPDEIGRTFARIDQREHPDYPGLSLVLISGEPPIAVRRANYYEDPHFLALFDPHPDHPARAISRASIRGEQLAPYVSALGPLQVVPIVEPGQPVLAGDRLADVMFEGLVGAGLLAPATGRVSLVNGGNAGGLREIVEIVHYADEPLHDPLSGVAAWLGRSDAIAAQRLRRTKVLTAIPLFLLLLNLAAGEGGPALFWAVLAGFGIYRATMWTTTRRQYAQAKGRIRTDESRRLPGLPNAPVTVATNGPSHHVIDLIRANRKIDAIKAYRVENEGVGLREAKDVIDALAREHS